MSTTMIDGQVSSIVTYGTPPGRVLSYDVRQLSLESLVALVSSGLSHKAGNEVASKVSTEKKRRAEAGEAPMTDDEISAMLNAGWDALNEKILNGTLGISTRAPRGTAIETVIRQIAKEELVARLSKVGYKFPTGKDKSGNPSTITVGTGEDAKVYTGAELLDSYVNANLDALTKSAKRRMDQAERDAAKAVAAGGGVVSVTSLGL